MSIRTKEWIAQHLKDMMRARPLSEIRVKEICEAAGIERSTFYYHFQDKYDLVAWIYYRVAEGMDICSYKSAAMSMRKMQEDAKFYKNAYDDNSQNALMGYILEYFQGLYVKKAKELIGEDNITEEIIFSIRMFVYGGIGMAREWFLTGGERPADELAYLMFQAMPQTMREVFMPKEEGDGR